MDGCMDGWIDVCMHGRMHEWMDGRMDGWMDGSLDLQSDDLPIDDVRKKDRGKKG